MKICNNHDELFSDPVGRCLPFGSGLLWVYSPTLVGCSLWGRPTRSDAEALVRCFDGYVHLRQVAQQRSSEHWRFDLVQDGRDIESADPAALEVLATWLRDHQAFMNEHVGRRVALMPRGIPGLTIAGLQVALALGTQLTIAEDAPSAFRMLVPEGGDAVYAEIEQTIAEVRRMTSVMVELRAVLAEAQGCLSLEAAASMLKMSTRSLQRQLWQAGVSFRDEQAGARFRRAEEMLRSDDKVSTIASQLGLSAQGLTQLTRARTGLTPAELRRRLRSA
jgi:AraC-like DNA-binding protein